MRLLLIGDIHHQASDRDSLLCSHALSLFERVAKNTRADAFLQVGDVIDGYQLPIEVSKKDLLDAMQALNAAAAPRPLHTVVGNHETYWLPDRPFHLKAFGLENMTRVVDLGAVRVVFVDLTVDGASHGELTRERAEFLEDAVRSGPPQPAIVIHHQPFHADEVICDHRHFVRNSGDYRALLRRLPTVAFVVTGHRHLPVLTRVEGCAPQVTLGAFCAHPFTLGEVVIDGGRTLTFREHAIDALLPEDEASQVASLIAHGQRLMVAENPPLWQDRPRLTPELQSIVVEWNGERAIVR